MNFKIGRFSIIGFNPIYHVYYRIPIFLGFDDKSFYLNLNLPIDTGYFDYLEHWEFPIKKFIKSLSSQYKFMDIKFKSAERNVFLNSVGEDRYSSGAYPHWEIILRFKRKEAKNIKPLNLTIDNLHIKFNVDTNKLITKITEILTNLL